MEINSDKSQAVIFGSKRFVNILYANRPASIVINNIIVEYATEAKYLGVTLTNTLSWEPHVTSVTKKINSTLYQLKLCKDLLPTSLIVREKLVSTLIYPYIDYCCGALIDITAEQDLRLHRALNASVRFIVGISSYEHISPYYVKLRWLKVDQRRKLFVGSSIYKILTEQRPKLLFANFSLRGSERRKHTRAHADLLTLPKCRTEFFKRFYRSYAAELWNLLPPKIRSAGTVREFRDAFYAQLLERGQ